MGIWMPVRRAAHRRAAARFRVAARMPEDSSSGWQGGSGSDGFKKILNDRRDASRRFPFEGVTKNREFTIPFLLIRHGPGHDDTLDFSSVWVDKGK